MDLDERASSPYRLSFSHARGPILRGRIDNTREGPLTSRVAPAVTSLFAAAASFAQTFEVASVKPNLLNDRIVTINVGPGGRFAARGFTLVLLMQRAYGVMDWNVSGGPGWIRSDRFDVTAQTEVTGNLTEKRLQPMLQQLLAERFKLQVHKSFKEMSGHALIVAKGGPKLKVSTLGEEDRDSFRMNGAGLSGQAISTPTLARFVAGKLGLVAVDETGLTDLYDFKVDWKVDPEAGGPDPRVALRFAAMTALQDQLGLKFIEKKITIPLVVIDHAERASASEN
jgi:uncharacterized protein (TIGR03435 family)